MNPMLSIIIPFYGDADKQLLNNCMQSIERQKLPMGSYEVIVADDDNGKKLGGARNKGVRMATGEYMLFIDADDFLLDAALPPLLQLLRDYRPDILSFDYTIVRNGKFKVKRQPPQDDIYPSGAAYMSTHNFFGTAWRHLYRRSLFVEHQLLFKENAYHEDEATVALAYFYAGKTIITNRVVYGYNQLPGSILHRPGKQQCLKRLNDFYSCLIDLHDFYQQIQIKANALQIKALQRRIRFLTIDYILQMRRNGCGKNESFIRLTQLRDRRLLPLPRAHYSVKYSLARAAINLMVFFRLF